jgi:hypothetical protein
VLEPRRPAIRLRPLATRSGGMCSHSNGRFACASAYLHNVLVASQCRLKPPQCVLQAGGGIRGFTVLVHIVALFCGRLNGRRNVHFALMRTKWLVDCL